MPSLCRVSHVLVERPGLELGRVNPFFKNEIFPDIQAQVAFRHVSASGFIPVITGCEIKEPPDTPPEQYVEQGVLARIQRTSHVLVENGKPGAETGDVVAVKVEVKVPDVQE